MEEALAHFIHGLPTYALAIVIVVALLAVGKGADELVEQAVHMSIEWGIPKAVVGATIVSLGTTTPEAAISVLAAVRGSPGLALGNAVGSIICDTGLILGISILIQPLKLDRKLVLKQGRIQFGAGLLLVAACFPYSIPGEVFRTGGRLPQWLGFIFLGLLALYIWKSIQWSRGDNSPSESQTHHGHSKVVGFVKLVVSIFVVVLASWVLVPAVAEAAKRLEVPDAIIAATLVAFGTSLPELVTAVTAARRGHGELALGNVIGADILNVLFVAGAAAAVTPGGLLAPAHFFKLLFPAMLFVLIVFRIGVRVSTTHMKRPVGFLLLGAYLVATLLGYI